MKDIEKGATKFGIIGLVLVWLVWAITAARPVPGFIQFLTSAILVAALFLALLYRLGQWKRRPDGSVPGVRPGKRSRP